MFSVNYWVKNEYGMECLSHKDFDDLEAALAFARSVAYEFFNITLGSTVIYSTIVVKPHFVEFIRFKGMTNE